VVTAQLVDDPRATTYEYVPAGRSLSIRPQHSRLPVVVIPQPLPPSSEICWKVPGGGFRISGGSGTLQVQ